MSKNKPRSDGRYQSKVYVGNIDGKPTYKYVYAETNKELQRKILELKSKLGKGVDIRADRESFDYWGRKWLDLKAYEVSENWKKALDCNYKKLEALYTRPVSTLRPIDLQEILIRLSKSNYSRRVLKAVRDIACGIMQLAADNRVIEYNFFLSISVPTAKKPVQKRRALTDEEQRWITDTPHRAQTAAMIMMYAGLRRGELIPLLWSDIDLDGKTISVTKSTESVGGIPHVKSGGKTLNAERIINIPEILCDYLRKQPRKTLLVCPSASGEMMSDSAWRRLWESYLNDLNLKYGDWENCIQTKGSRPSKFAPGEKPMLIPAFTAHWLRHTFITLMYLAGVDVLTAKEQAGHADIKTTLSIYTHLDKQHKKNNLSKLDDYLSGKNEKKAGIG